MLRSLHREQSRTGHPLFRPKAPVCPSSSELQSNIYSHRVKVYPWRLMDLFEVRFSGPPMTRRTRGSLSAAAITSLADRHNSPAALLGGASKLHEFVVLVRAPDAYQAVEQTRAAVQAGGIYTGFTATPPKEPF